MNYIRFWQASGESEKTSIRVKTKLEQMTEEKDFIQEAQSLSVILSSTTDAKTKKDRKCGTSR